MEIMEKDLGTPKVLHIVAGSLTGGAARGAYWLHLGLLELGVRSVVLNNARDGSTGVEVHSLAATPIKKLKFLWFAFLGRFFTFFYFNKKSRIFSTGFVGVDITKHPEYHDADVIHLHWVNGLLPVHILKKIKKPLVWTLRDMWPFTGGCHYSMDCEKYTTGCGGCPQLGSKNKFDLSRLVVWNKKRSIPNSVRVVGISNWLSTCAKKSSVFQDRTVQTIANNIDTQQFFPIDSNSAREALGLPKNKKILLIGARAITDFYKGLDLFLDALACLKNSDVHIVTFGKPGLFANKQTLHGFTELGYLNDVSMLRQAYSASDLFVAPSRMDAFGKTLAESMACGTPVVCFDATGTADIVAHLKTGYKAKAFDIYDMAKGIDWVLSLDEINQEILRAESRKRAVDYFDSRRIAQEYRMLYDEILKREA
jgi:glycosyltransferase involved in cell wall biosynthesis